jgi:hypothetical protein
MHRTTAVGPEIRTIFLIFVRPPAFSIEEIEDSPASHSEYANDDQRDPDPEIALKDSCLSNDSSGFSGAEGRSWNKWGT